MNTDSNLIIKANGDHKNYQGDILSSEDESDNSASSKPRLIILDRNDDTRGRKKEAEQTPDK